MFLLICLVAMALVNVIIWVTLTFDVCELISRRK